MKQVLFARGMVTPSQSVSQAAVLIEDGVIQAAGTRAGIAVPAGTPSEDFGDALLAPGLIDIHVHGGAGVDVMNADRTALDHLRLHLARHGVTTFLATTVSAPWNEVLTAVERLAAAGMDIHLEGPFLSGARRGIHPQESLQAPTLARLDELCERGRGRVRMVTMAPELDGAEAFIAEATRRGIRVSLGHSDANTEQTRRAIAAGACHVTHTFNAMRPLHQREPGILGVALSEPELSADIIADGVHVDPALVKLFLRCKALGRAVLISDGISATGMGDGKYLLGAIEVTVQRDCCHTGGTLAGSVLTLERAIQNVKSWTGCGWAEAVRLASQNPATLMEWKSKGKLEAGRDADVAVFSPAGEVIAAYASGVRLH